MRAQIDLNNLTLNKIDSIRDAHRKEAMNELDEWQSECGLPILNDQPGQVQENRKPYKWVCFVGLLYRLNFSLIEHY